jgi:hypothetical protein
MERYPLEVISKWMSTAIGQQETLCDKELILHIGTERSSVYKLN